jgi:glycosyltransferase involved in cell wall biosynthesis
MNSPKVCLFFNDLAIYRKAIYTMIDKEFDCDWYIEDINTGVKLFDEKELQRVYRLPVRSLGPFYCVKGLLQLLKKDYDVYLMLGATRNISLFAFGVTKKLFFPKKRLYFWSHGFYGKESSLELALWKKPLFKLADAIFPYSEYSKALMIKNGFKEEVIHPIHNSLDYEEQKNIRNSIEPSNLFNKHFGNSNPVIIMIGRLNMRKHLDMLFEAVDLLKKKGELYNIVLIGDGESRQSLEQLADIKALDNQTWFYGPSYDEIQNASLLFNADVCVVPGDIGLTAIHALMFGTPSITHNCYKYQGPEFEAIKPGVTGDFYEYGSVSSLADTISKWFLDHKDKRENVRKECYKEIDTNWNPFFQMEVIKKYLL